ncbi:helix-turn-helix transcriptional regulator [Catellatospora methionotrophica]|uniref:helix-turn-helix transcriptional regulator n=1 Tax=Catellatospora methionotrophica TaxID=121620 RepID=UPI0033F0A704
MTNTSDNAADARLALGNRLARLRQAAGYTQESFAPRTFYGRSSIANIETGRQIAPREFWIRCDEVLGTGGVLTQAHDRLNLAEYHRHVGALSLDGAPGLPTDAWGLSEEAGATRSCLISYCDVIHHGDRPCTEQRPTVDLGYVEHWNRLLSVLVAAGNTAGGQGLIDIVAHEVRIIAEHARSTAGATATALRLTTARWLEFGSWVADNQGEHATATTWLTHAHGLAVAADNEIMAAYLLMRRAQQATEHGDPQTSLALLGQVNLARMPARIGALLATRSAQAHAALRNGPASRRAIRTALTMLDRGDTSDALDAELADHSTTAYVLAHEGLCLSSLAEPNGAVATLESVLATWPHTQRLDEGLFRAHLAVAQAGAGAYDEAVAEAGRALQIGAQTRSTRTLRVVEQIMNLDLRGAAGHTELAAQWTATNEQRAIRQR